MEKEKEITEEKVNYVSVRLNDEEFKKLKQLAAQEGRSFNGLVKALIRNERIR